MYSGGVAILVSEPRFMMSLKEVWSRRVRIGGREWFGN